MVIGTSGLMIAAMALNISGSLNIFKGTPKPDSLTEWKTGVILILVTWILQVFWSLFSLMSSQGEKDAPGYHGGTAVSLITFIKHRHLGVQMTNNGWP